MNRSRRKPTTPKPAAATTTSSAAPARRNEVAGAILRPSAGAEAAYADGLAHLVSRLGRAIGREMRRVFREHTHHGAMDSPDETPWGNVSSQARIALNALLDEYQPQFNAFARDATGKMIDRTLRHSAATLEMSLRDMVPMHTLSTDILNDRLREIVTASANQAAGLIKLIPQKYLQEVGGEVARSITSGLGLADLVPYLTKKYDGNVRWARLVALDQTRKVYSSVNAGRMQALGLQEYRWIHTPGSWEPRKHHEQMHGKVYRLDDPPVISAPDDKRVERGIPGQAPFCRCTMQPIVKFGASRAAENG